MGDHVQQLHLVGLTTDLSGLIFSARKGAKSGSYVIRLDDDVVETIVETLRRRESSSPASTPSATSLATLAREAEAEPRPPRPDSSLSPREIQARLRAGHSIQDVAEEAGVDIAWVDRFAAPVLAEQRQVVERAGELLFARARGGESSQPLATAVRWNLAEKGVPLVDETVHGGWSAHQLVESIWVLRFQYHHRGRRQVAEWELDVRDGTLAARNRLATQLGWVEKGRRRPRPPVDEVPDEDEAPAPRKRATRRKKAAKKKTTTKKAAKRSAKTSTRKPAVPRKATPAKKVTKRARPAPAPRKKITTSATAVPPVPPSTTNGTGRRTRTTRRRRAAD